jgi:hypothetical protein
MWEGVKMTVEEALAELLLELEKDYPEVFNEFKKKSGLTDVKRG